MLVQRASRGKGARMSGAQRGTESDDSKGLRAHRSPLPTVLALRAALAATGFAGALFLVAGTFTAMIRITVGSTSRGLDADTTQSGWDRHGPALLLLGLAGLWLLGSALRGTRAAMAGLALVGVAAMGIAMAWDRPHLHDTGEVGNVYATATADPGAGYYLETLGGALVLVTGGALLLLSGPSADRAGAGEAVAHNDDGREG
jgi:hypothetical protein